MRVNIFSEDNLGPVLDMVEACRGVRQDPRHHPEGDVYIHSLQAVARALYETDDPHLILAALLHDVGKSVEDHGHEEHSEKMLEPYMNARVQWFVGQHMRIKTYLSGQMRRPGKCRELVSHPWFPQLVQLARFDQMARIKGWIPRMDRFSIIDSLNKKLNTE